MYFAKIRASLLFDTSKDAHAGPTTWTEEKSANILEKEGCGEARTRFNFLQFECSCREVSAGLSEAKEA